MSKNAISTANIPLADAPSRFSDTTDNHFIPNTKTWQNTSASLGTDEGDWTIAKFEETHITDDDDSGIEYTNILIYSFDLS